MMRPSVVFAIIWIGWIVSWIGASFWSARTEKRVATWPVWVSRVALLVGAILLLHSTRRLLREPMLWHVGYDGAYTLAGLTLVGILFAWWARIHLGRLWSGTITRKENHHVVDSGPYALVRHPIYTGLLLAILGSAVAVDEYRGLLAVAIATEAIVRKLRLEERWLTDEFGGEYDGYRRDVKALVPGVV